MLNVLPEPWVVPTCVGVEGNEVTATGIEIRSSPRAWGLRAPAPAPAR